MFTDERLIAALTAMVRGIDTPPAPLHEIQQKIARSDAAPPRPSRNLRPALAIAAAVAVLVAAFPSTSLGLVQTIEARYRSALQAMGGIAPPSAPKALVSTLTPQIATLASAQSRVGFTITPPAGLPHDVVSARIHTIPTGIYSKITRSWKTGPSEVTFTYRRSGGRSFDLLADRFDPQAGLPSKYLFEALDPAPDGRPVIVKHERFAWRNGNQVMTAIAAESLSASEIQAIRIAMRGVALPRRNPHLPGAGTSLKLYRITRP